MNKFTTPSGISVYLVREGEKLTADAIEEDFAFVISAKGYYAKRKNFLYEGLFKLDGAPDFLGEVDDTIRALDLKIPQDLFFSIEKFFGRIYEKLGTEVQCFLYYNTETGKWAYCVPQQTVNGAHVDYDENKGATYILEDNLEEGLDALPDEEGWTKIGTIHSHASMGAFHSGTDDKDEFGFDGIHITIGNFNTDRHTYACRVMYGKLAIKKELPEVVEFAVQPGAFPSTLEDRVAKDTVVTGYNQATYSGASSYYTGSSTWNGYGRNYNSGWDADDYMEGAPLNTPAKSTAVGAKAATRRRRAATYQYEKGVIVAQEEK